MTPKPTDTSPMMAQYLHIKQQYPDALLFYRMGDFYELFFDDAVVASKALDITLTRRGKPPKAGYPMCGVPFHSADSYLQTLIRNGFKVAICEQLEEAAEARKRRRNSLVRRDVVRVMTHGTLTEDELLSARQHNFLAAIAELRGRHALAWADMSSGQLRVMRCAAAALSSQLARIAPSELLIPEPMDARLLGAEFEGGNLLTRLPAESFDSMAGEQRVAKLFAVKFVDGFGDLDRAELSALGAILGYIERTQKGSAPLLNPPVRERLEATMQIDGATRRNLEITRNLSGGQEHTLLASMDRCLTSAGARLLHQRLSAPSLDLEAIRGRLSEISHFLSTPDLRRTIRAAMRQVPDISRALSRLNLGRGGPRDLVSVRSGLAQAAVIHRSLEGQVDLNDSLAADLGLLIDQQPTADRLEQAIVADPPVMARDGGFVASGYSEELDQERKIKADARAVIASLQGSYVELTGVKSLRIKHNNVLGYFVEVPLAHAKLLQEEPLSNTFSLRQTIASGGRFGTAELAETASRILNADSRCLELELAIFESLRSELSERAAPISVIANLLARLDVATALAKAAEEEKWTQPKLDDSGRLSISGGRHPVVEQAMRTSGDDVFVANDCTFGGRDETPRVCLVTGPNMAGKSTYLRQNALIVLMAQCGSYVPAESAHIGLVSQLFSRVGAADELARGRSTFMVEMVETASILNQSDRNALVILDEIGRGTATYDGLSIAWATIEYIHDVVGCRTLFATHYHELTRLTSRLKRLQNLTISVAEWDNDVVFLHEVREGSADRSYGVHVARLAGVPPAVVDRATEILELFERDERDGRGRTATVLDELPLFVAARNYGKAAAPSSPIMQRVREANPDEMSPVEALSLIYELRRLLDEGGREMES
ncbi:MAG: DNA mismatch repair protein MutS [Rhodobacteraceae bacterium]|nr:DNA mismatch repair protein MutS [Paracoccaceae bacterium]